jgi:UMF1 family MFS transporter
VAGGYISYDKVSFYIVGLIAGIAMGSSQAASRALMGGLIPEGKEAEFYGFYGLTGKFSAILGPLFFGVVSTLTGSQRTAVLSILIFFIVGFILLNKVNIKEKINRMSV